MKRRSNLTTLTCIAIALVFSFYATSQANSTKPTNNYKLTIYSYADGSGNVYNIFPDKKGWVLEYKPVQPGFSSSGIYSGGEYVKKKISKSQYKKILSNIDKAVKNTKIHIKERIMTSGLITIQKNKSTKTYIIKPNSTEQLDIERVLKEIKN